MDQHRYYWLKLNKDFFNSKRIKKLRKLAGGDTYTVIYLKMQLLSLEKEGYLEYTGLEKTFPEELALDIDEDVENVKVTVQYLLSCGLLVEDNERQFTLPFVKDSIISETSSTERVRRFRSKQKALQCNTNVTPVTLHRNVDIDIDIDKDIDIDTDIEKEKRIKKKNVADAPEYFPDDELNKAFLDYIAFRKDIKAKMTDRAITLSINQLKKLSRGDNDKAIKILNQSVMNGWKGLYDIKDEKGAKPQSDRYAEVDNWLEGARNGES